MPRTARVLAVLLACAALLLGGLTAAAGAIAAPTAPNDDPPSIAQLCAATGDQSIDALLDGVADTDLVGALAPLLDLTVPQDQGRVLKADVDLDDVRTALNCTTDPDPTTSPSAPTTSTSSPNGDERDCSDFATRQDAQDFYDSVTTPSNPDPSKLDQDGDGIACETTEGPVRSGTGNGASTTIDIDPTADDGSSAGGTQVTEVPEGSASTGGGV